MTALAEAIFGGVVHPLANVWPLLPDEELAALAESIAENGQEFPIVLDAHGRLVDGRNRLAAIELLDGVEPWFQMDGDLTSDEQVAAFIRAMNADRRHLTSGQQAMGRALMLAAQGRRRNGRWEYGTNSQDPASSRGEQDNLRKAGLVLDTAERARALGDEFNDWAGLPTAVMNRDITLDFAYRTAMDFETKAALAEAMKTQPLTEALTRLEVILEDARSWMPLPVLNVPLTKQHRAQIEALKKTAADLVTALRDYTKEATK